jgi:hypothetical protein
MKKLAYFFLTIVGIGTTIVFGLITVEARESEATYDPALSSEDAADQFAQETGESAIRFFGWATATCVSGVTTLAIVVLFIKNLLASPASTLQPIEPIKMPPTRIQSYEPSPPAPRQSALYKIPTPATASAEQILSEAQRLYKEGDIAGAMFILEMSDDPRAKRALARLQGLRK